MVALLNAAEKTNGLGNLNPLLYQLAAVPATYAAAFHDVTSGSIACIAGAAECTSASQGDYAAQAGYDEATGPGSPDLNAFVSAWPIGPTASLLPTVSYIISPADVATTAGQTLPLQIYVANVYIGPPQPLPTGTVSVSIDGVDVNPSLALGPSSDPASSQVGAVYNLVVPSTPGYHVVTTTYSGDALHAPSSGTYPFLVGSVEASGSFSLAAANLTIAADRSDANCHRARPHGLWRRRQPQRCRHEHSPAAGRQRAALARLYPDAHGHRLRQRQHYLVNNFHCDGDLERSALGYGA